jgi:hypothetical protein
MLTCGTCSAVTWDQPASLCVCRCACAHGTVDAAGASGVLLCVAHAGQGSSADDMVVIEEEMTDAEPAGAPESSSPSTQPQQLDADAAQEQHDSGAADAASSSPPADSSQQQLPATEGGPDMAWHLSDSAQPAAPPPHDNSA